jgi:predicted phosphoribosyltransferase
MTAGMPDGCWPDFSTIIGGSPDVVVLALPQGGVPVGYEVARALGAPLDVFVVRKLGVPEREELAMGAIATGGVVVLNEDVIRGLNISPEGHRGHLPPGDRARQPLLPGSGV